MACVVKKMKLELIQMARRERRLLIKKPERWLRFF